LTKVYTKAITEAFVLYSVFYVKKLLGRI